MKNLGSAWMFRHGDAIVHPFAFASCGDDACLAQVGEMARNLWLGCIQNLYEVADADFLFSHEVKETQAGVISQRLEELLHVEQRFTSHTKYIRIDECVCKTYIRVDGCIGACDGRDS